MAWLNNSSKHLIEARPSGGVQRFPRNALAQSLYNREALPFLDRLISNLLEWVPGYAKLLKLKKEISLLEKEKGEVLSLPLSLDDQKAWLRELHAKDTESFNRDLASLIAKPQFSGFKSLPENLGKRSLISKECLESTLKLLPDRPGAISTKDKNKRLSKVETRIEELRAQCAPLDGPEWRENTVSRQDARALFVSHWRLIQSKLSKPANFDGVLLKRCLDGDQKAWEILELKPCVNLQGKSPYDPKDF